MTGENLPWAGYVRVSHVGGRGGDTFHSVRDQTEAIQRWCDARGQAVTLLEPELDESGGREDRPVLTSAIEGIEQGRYRGLVVAYLSRASRSARHLLAMWDRVENAGGQVVAVQENIDTSTPAGRLTRTMLAAVAEFELDGHRDRFDHLRQVATDRGVWQRRQTPRGYARDPATRKLVPDDSAPLVREAFRARARGASMSSLARTLNMTTSGVRQLLANRVYLGELRVGQYVNPAAHPPLVTDDEFLAVQGLQTSRPAKNGERALLAGLVRCTGCSHAMSRSRDVYNCPCRRCEQRAAITRTRLDAYVETIAVAQLRRVVAPKAARDTAVIDDAKQEVTRAESELAAYLEATSAADLGGELFAAQARRRQQAVTAARERLGESLRTATGVPVVGDAQEFWDGLSVEHRNRLLGRLIEVVLVQAVGRGQTVNVADRVRVIAHGSGLVTMSPSGGVQIPVTRLVLPDADDPRVLGV